MSKDIYNKLNALKNITEILKDGLFELNKRVEKLESNLPITPEQAREVFDGLIKLDPEHGKKVTNEQFTEYQNNCTAWLIINYEVITKALEHFAGGQNEE